MTGRRLLSAGHVALWVLIGLVVIDISINVLLAYPSDPKVTNPSRLRQYFEYGRSTEGQLARMTRKDKAETAPITLSGWYQPLEVVDYPAKGQNPIVTIYGMSHAVRLGAALARTSDKFTARTVGAPGAPSNWSYGAYLRDRGGHKSRAVVLAFMSQSIPMITTVSAITWARDLPMPYTSDRFYLADDELRVIEPPYTSFDQYREAFFDPEKWAPVRKFLADHDTMYNPFLLQAGVLDHSSLFRLIRRAYGQRVLRSIRKTVLDSSGFQPESEQIKVARAIVRDFARQARSDGMLPVIFIANNLGYSDHLFRALQPALEADHIPYVSSHTIVSPDDPRGYLPDSHFTDEVDDKLARALAEVVSRGE